MWSNYPYFTGLFRWHYFQCLKGYQSTTEWADSDQSLRETLQLDLVQRLITYFNRIHQQCHINTSICINLIVSGLKIALLYTDLIEKINKNLNNILVPYNIILYFRLPYFHASNSALFST